MTKRRETIPSATSSRGSSSAEPSSERALSARQTGERKQQGRPTATPGATQEVDRVLHLLRSRIHERGFTQLRVQEALGWGRTYISQLLRKQKSLRFDQILQILEVIEVEPAEFFADLYELPTDESEPVIPAPRTIRDTVSQLAAFHQRLDASRPEARELHTAVLGLVRLLVGKELIEPEEYGASIVAFGGFPPPDPPQDTGRAGGATGA